MKFIYPDGFPSQFMLGEALPKRPGGTCHDLMGLEVMTFDPLAVHRVEDADGMCLGMLLGTPIDYQRGEFPQGRLELAATYDGDPDAFVEQHIYALGGSFLFVLATQAHRRVYLDACGSLSAVYDPQTRRVAATGLLLLEPAEAKARFDQELHEALHVLRDGWYPAGLTAHHGVHRLMPNHYLDLDTFQTHRHWPMAPIPRAPDPSEACGRVLHSTGAITQTLAAAAPVTLALTAGNETRMILAANREIAQDPEQNIEFATVITDAAALDLIRARELAQRFGLRHREVPLKLGDEEDGWAWHARAGWSVGGAHIQTHPTIQGLRDRPYFIGGLGGEIGRGFFWRPDDDDETPLTAEGIWARMGLPEHPRGLEAVERWMPSVAGYPTLLALDLAYLEIRMGCWGFALAYTDWDPIDIHPLISRESFAAMLSLPPEWRRMKDGTNDMIQEVVRLGWPELLELRISRFGDYRDHLGSVTRALRQPHLIMKKLRKRFG